MLERPSAAHLCLSSARIELTPTVQALDHDLRELSLELWNGSFVSHARVLACVRHLIAPIKIGIKRARPESKRCGMCRKQCIRERERGPEGKQLAIQPFARGALAR